MIGGGAAGFFCAVNAAELSPDLEVIILERTGKLLSKVRVSGGGRCNVTHACYSISEMARNYPRGGNFLKKAFKHFFTTDTIQWFLKFGVVLKTEPDGRMFPVSNSSESIIDCLVKQANKLNVEVMMNRQVVDITFDMPSLHAEGEILGKEMGRRIIVILANGEQLPTNYLCIAPGGFSKRSQFDWLNNLGHSFAEPVPSLFTFNIPGNPISTLMGISVEKVVIKINGTKYSQAGPVLITHWGLSGPAVLKLSSFAAIDLAQLNYHFTISINWIPLFNERTLREEFIKIRFQQAAQKIVNRNAFHLPQRLWAFFLKLAGVDEDARWADLPSKPQNILIKLLTSHEMVVKGKTTFKEEFVTSGGINLAEIDPSTMQSRLQSNVYFAGEVMNVDGITGGFNFQHAWSSGYIAAQSIADSEALNLI